jgi:hypothetical protein
MSIPVAVSIKNWEFLKQHKRRGRKLDDFLTTIIIDWSRIAEIKEAAEYYSDQYEDALKSIKKYRQGMEELLLIETLPYPLRSRINSILGYEVGSTVGPSRGVAENCHITSNNMQANLPNHSEVIKKT